MTLEKALNDGRGALDAWLEVNNEAEVRDAINTLIAEAVAKEREACAKIAESFYHHIRQYTTDVPDIEQAIRARGNK